MALDSIRLNAVITEVIGDMPHPRAPELKVKDFRAHVQVAAILKGGVGAVAEDVVNAYHLLKSMEMSPAEFEHAWQVAQPIANRFLGRDPLPQELKQLHGAHPADFHEYFAQSAHPEFPEIKALDYAKYFHAAQPIAHATVGRNPLPVEVARFAAAGYDEDSIHTHYTMKGNV